MIRRILALGDCNTLGAGELEHNSYPERVAAQLNCEVNNVGHTMATTREGGYLLESHLNDADCVCIQFGLVDSYTTFKYSPYVLYYPDKPLRKLLRSIVKKYKKTCRKFGLNKWIGEVNVVPIEEYENNLREMIEAAAPRPVLLIETVPNKQLWRNDAIKRYNAILRELAHQYEHCRYIPAYDFFLENLENYYRDETHCNGEGYEVLASQIVREIKKL